MYSILMNKALQTITCLVALVVMTGTALAVDAGKTSYTAEAVCAFRSIGALDPDAKTRNPDNMAVHFVGPGMKQGFPGIGLDFEDAKLAMDRMNNGVFYYVNARTLHMDAMLAASLKEGAKQVVILGAGFDSRAYRFHEDYPSVRFFEIDLPATSADKQGRVQKILGQVPNWVTFVPIDFNTQTLKEVLIKAGFNEKQKTFYVWEGVTYFISEAGVDSTLRFIAEHSAPGSRVVFDYMLEDVVLGTDYSPFGARRTVFRVALHGEPYVFGIAPKYLKTFVHQRGLKVLTNLGPDDLAQRYLVRSDGAISGRISGFLRIVHAEVPQAVERQQLMASAGSQNKSAPPNHAKVSLSHRVPVPDGVQDLLQRYSKAMLAKDITALMDHFSNNYQSQGRRKSAVKGFLQRAYFNRPITAHRFVLTKFQQDGDQAYVDGFIHRGEFRTPVMVHQLIKESDSRWRWYGDQQ